MIRYILVFTVFLSSVTAHGQKFKVDSLTSLLRKSSGEKRVEILHALIMNLWLTQPDTAKQYAREAIYLSDQLKNVRLRAISLRLMGGGLNYLGMYDSALYYTKSSHELAIQLNDSTQLSSTLNNIGFVYYYLGNYSEALDNLLRAMNIKTKIHQDYGLGNTINNVGLVYLKLKEYDMARKYFNDAFKVGEQLNDDDVKVYTLNSMGLSYLEQENFLEAEKYYKRALEIEKAVSNKNWHSESFSGLGQVYYAAGKINLAREQFKISLTMRKEIRERNGISEVYYFLSKISAASGRVDSAFYYLNASQRIANEIKAMDRILKNFQLYKDLYIKRKRFDSALHFQTRYAELLDKQFRENIKRSIAGIQLKIQEEATSKQLAIKDDQLERKTRQSYFSVAMAMVTIAFALVVFWYYTAQKRLSVDLKIKNEKISAQKNEIVRKNLELHHLNLEKNNLIGIVAHDLKSPLNQIIGLINLIKISPASINEEARNYIKMIETSSLRLSDMIAKILDVEAVEAKKVKLKFEMVNFSELVFLVADRFTLEAQRKQIQFQFSLSDDVIAHIDRSYADQIVENLISNAIKFSPHDKKVYINVTSDQNTVQCEIRDEGPGLKDEDKKKLFRKYQKLSATPTGNETSTGLGLSIVKRFVDAMKGKIWCESEIGKGASFFVTFSAHPAHTHIKYADMKASASVS